MLGDQESLAGELLEQLCQDLERDTVRFGDFPGAGGLILLREDVLEGHEAVIGLLAQSNHGPFAFLEFRISDR